MTPTADTSACFIIHELAHATAALEAARRHNTSVTLVSAPGAVRTGGAGWWRELITAARSDFPDAEMRSVLDCADEPGTALSAIRAGVEAIALSAPEDARARVAEIAEQASVALVSINWPDAVDLARANDPQAVCENRLAKQPASVANPDALG